MSTGCPDPQSASMFIVAVSGIAKDQIYSSYVCHFNFILCCRVNRLFLCVAQISMTSVMRWTVQVPGVLRLTVAVALELSWDQTDRRAWVRQAKKQRGRLEVI